MELQESKNLITESKNICIIPSENAEAVSSALALFYTLKEKGKNVNLIMENIPGNLNFLAPSLDFISYPKNFVISIPNRIADISQIYYEKSDETVKIFLKIESGKVKKEDISFYFSETKPDLVITIGIKDYLKELQNKLNSFGFLLDSEILNIDNQLDTVQENKKFGKINLIEESSLSEIVFDLVKNGGNPAIKKEHAACLLAGIVIYTDNFKNKITAEVFELAGRLMKAGADLKEVTGNIYKTE